MSGSLLPLLFATSLLTSPALPDKALQVQVTYSREIRETAYTGRVYLLFSERNREPRLGPDWFTPEPFVSLEVENWQPGEPLLISLGSSKLRRFPRSFEGIDLSKTQVQAVARFAPEEREVGRGPGNGFSQVLPVGDARNLSLTINQIVPSPRVPQHPRTQVVEVESPLLSAFHGRSVSLKAAVTVPEGYAQQADKRFPAIYEVPGFGGTHLRSWDRHQRPRTNPQGVDFIRVMLDPSCAWGHHVFANSSNNGPYGDALIQELIPVIDQKFRTEARSAARFVTGHSSGGWSSLWLQVAYAQAFGGVWSTAPDPVDFRDFQRINIYRREENMFHDPQGSRRPLARIHGEVRLWYDDFSHMEDVLGYGGQLESFEAVFSPRGENGLPERLWDRTTGEINPAVAQAWERYDINLVLRRNWAELEPHLRGKIHVFMGMEDTFYLEGATVLLKQTLQELGSDAVVELIPQKDHFNLFEGGLSERIEEQMARHYLEHRN